MQRVGAFREGHNIARVVIPPSLPGTKFSLTLCHRWKDPNDPRNRSSPIGSSGLYKVTITFSRSSGTPDDSVQLDKPDDSVQLDKPGDSFIVIRDPDAFRSSELPDAKLVYGGEDQQIQFEAYANNNGRLASMVAQNVHASSFNDAERKVLLAVNGLLSRLSVKFNVPIDIATIETVEIATGNPKRTCVVPYVSVQLNPGLIRNSSRDFNFYASLYREALNSNSPAYKFLCFYKIIEGLLKRRERIASECKNRGEEPKRYNEVVPATPAERKAWLTKLFNMPPTWNDSGVVPQEAEGKKFGKVINEYLGPLRVRIAHAVLDTGELALMADEILDIDRIHRWLGLTQSIARQMLKNDFPDQFDSPAESASKT
mgnify:CR=1 FL=1|jgi:hypothetical protein